MEEELKGLTTERASIKRQVTRYVNYLDKLGEHTLNAAVLRERTIKFEPLLDQYNKIQNQIYALMEEEEDDEEHEEYENKFYIALAKAKTLLEEFRTAATITHNNNIGNDSRENVNASTASNSHVSEFRLPKISLPNFSGSYDAWYPFYNTFKSMIYDNNCITDLQKLHYLVASLKGEAAEVIHSLEICDESFSDAWQMLIERYDNKRRIVQKHIREIANLPVVSKESAIGLRKLIDAALKHMRALKVLKRPTETWDDIIIEILCMKLDPITNKEWERSLTRNEFPQLKKFADFIIHKIETMESSTAISISVPTSSINSTKTNANMCQICNENHTVYKCPILLNVTPAERIRKVKQLGLCMNCLKTKDHLANACTFSPCRICSKKHNSLLHICNPPNSYSTTNSQQNSSQPSTSTMQCFSSTQNNNRQILLPTAVVYIYDCDNNQYECKILLDSGSQCCLITNKLATKLRLKTENNPITISGISASQSQVNLSTAIRISSRINAYETIIKCHIVEKITNNVPMLSFGKNKIKLPEHIQLADPDYNISKEIELLVGAQLFWELLCKGQIKLGKNMPILHKSVFGWLISGTSTDVGSMDISCNMTITDTLQFDLEKFWKLEELESTRTFTPDEKVVESHFLSTHRRNENGRFIVQLPLKNNFELGESRNMAIKRFYSLERRLNMNLELKETYNQFIDEYRGLGHMKQVHDDGQTKGFYLPHHPIIKDSSITTKLRVVFDASMKSTNGRSLNENLMIGPTIQQDLFSILTRFRTHKYVLTADITKMYRQILIDETQRSFQRIIWREHPNMPLKTFELQTVTYGTASASFLAIRCLQQLGLEGIDEQPAAANAVINDFYVDDLLTGANTIAEAVMLRDGIINLLHKGGFQLNKWNSNDRKVTEHIPNATTNTILLNLDKDATNKTLGLQWNSHTDTLQYAVPKEKFPNKLTKRTILSYISQIFDPLSLLSPVTITAKLIIQELWKLKLNWDSVVPKHIETRWSQYYDQLHNIAHIQIPRNVVDCSTATNIQLHGFSDASQVAYGACLYVRYTNHDDVNQTQLLCAKSKVASLKGVNLPRLELSGALLLARLVDQVKKTLNITVNETLYWTDSTIVKAWIQSNPNRWKIYVANRVTEIQELTSSKQWFHVSGKDNPADLLTRGITADMLINHNSNVWWHGPAWLNKGQDLWKINKSDTETDISSIRIEERKEGITLATTVENCLIYEHFSTLSKLTRVVAFCYRFAHNCKHKNNKLTGALKANELIKTELLLIKQVQKESFREDIDDLEKGKKVKGTSKLVCLNPFLDQNGLIRIGGRLHNATISYNAKHPIVLPKDNHLTKLIILNEHNKHLHAGVQGTIAAVRQQYWPLSARTTTRKIIHNCMRCFRAKPKGLENVMGNLPATRITQSRPFINCGVDYFGPMLVKEGTRKSRMTKKAYGAVFVCFATKAIHLELVSDMTTDAFIAAFQRFISRRGKVVNIYSDNGTNFVGANGELNELYDLFTTENHQSAVIDAFYNDKINWHFQPPRAPHFGGIYESCVKSTKHHLRRVANNTQFNFEELYTLLTQVEAVLNSRPLTPLSNDPNDMSYLSPGHFLIGDCITAIPEPSLANIKVNRLSKWQHIQQLKQSFWARWSTDYLSQLQQRNKWTTAKGEAVKKGQLVVIKDDNLPPLRWIIGRITQVHRGTDGVVRVVTVRTASGSMKRATARVCVLPIETEE